MDGRVDAIVFGCGSSGTMTGLSRYFARVSPATEFILADPVGSILAQYINEGTLSTKSASWMVEGIGEDFLPSISDFSRVKKAYAISDKESFLTARELLGKEGVLGGSSTGTLVAAALKYCARADGAQARRHVRLRHRQQVPVEDVQRLLDARQRLPRARALRRPARPDPASVRAPRHRRRRADDLLITAYNRMKLYDVSQLPVMDGDHIVGIVDESDVLLHVYRRRSALPRSGLDGDGHASCRCST